MSKNTWNDSPDATNGKVPSYLFSQEQCLKIPFS